MNLVNNHFKLNRTGISVTNLARIITWFLFQIVKCNLSNCINVSKKLLLQGLDPKLSGYEAALALYEWGVEKKPEKVCHLIFLEHMPLEEFGKKDIKKYLKEYSHFSLLQGTV